MIHIASFTGEFPRTNKELLPDNAAQYALDCDFLTGALVGLRNDDYVARITSSTTIKSLFVYEGGASTGRAFWWPYDVDAVKSPVATDEYNRFYWSDGTNYYVSHGDIGGSGEPATTNLRISVRGTDGVTRVANITLA